MNRKYRGLMREGKFKPLGIEYYNDMRQYENKEVVVTVEKYSPSRSLKENAYYWGVVVQLLADHFGYLPDEMHDALRYEHLMLKMDDAPRTAMSTASLTVAEFEDYLSRIRTWASVKYEVYIPLPNEVDI